MKKTICILLSFWYFACQGQTNRSFSLTGIINTNSGRILFLPVGNISDYPKSFKFEDITVKNGKFRIAGKINYPYQVYLGLKQGDQYTYLSGFFFIEPGVQHIVCNKDSLRTTPDIQNVTMLEYLNEYQTPVHQALDTIENYNKRNRLKRVYLYEYAKKHPHSYVALWEISHYLLDGYDSYLDSAFVVLSDEIKSSATGRFIKDDLNHLVLTDTGKIFPNIEVINPNGKSGTIDLCKTKTKYILIDFWFSHCGPCLGQFPDYLQIVEKYRNKGFAMIGISSDESPGDIGAWKKVIKSQSLNWLQYRTNQKTMNILRIRVAPYSFLLDHSGRIIAKDLGPKEVSDFLQANLNE